MSEHQELKHDFDMSWMSPLDMEQIHYLFFYIFSSNQLFAPKPGTPQAQAVNPNTIHNWSDLAFYLDTRCPDSDKHPPEIYRMVWNNFQKMKSNDAPWSYKYSRWVQLFPDSWLSFMNYGYYDFESNNSALELEPNDEEWRYSIQLYHRLLGSVSIEGKDVLEVGCGRGGGASYISRYMKPKSYLGTDGTMSNIMFCKQAHDVPSLAFQWSRAEKLSLPEGGLDVVLTLESFNYYDSFTDFVGNMYSVLKSGGHFLLSTWDTAPQMLYFRTMCEKRGFELVEEEDMSFNVEMALEAFDGGKALFTNRETVNRKLLYIESWRRLYDVKPIVTGEARYIRYVFRKP